MSSPPKQKGPGGNPDLDDEASVHHIMHGREMRRMQKLINWRDHHEHWWLREQRWRDQERMS